MLVELNVTIHIYTYFFLIAAYAPVKPLKSSFTMKREFDKAREEQELIFKLREVCFLFSIVVYSLTKNQQN